MAFIAEFKTYKKSEFFNQTVEKFGYPFQRNYIQGTWIIESIDHANSRIVFQNLQQGLLFAIVFGDQIDQVVRFDNQNILFELVA
jgi:hypothetical protein